MNFFCIRYMIIAWLTVMTLSGAVFAEELSIPGSGNPEYVLTQLANAFNQQQSQHTVTVPPSTGTAGALHAIEEGPASVARVGRPLKGDERNKGITYVPLGRDTVVFVAGEGVTARNITATQVMGVFSGKLTDWRELSGDPGPIRAIGRECTDASRRAIIHLIKPFESIEYGKNIKVVHLDPDLIMLLDRYPTSLGFLNKSALGACKGKVIHLAFDGVKPTSENLEKELYPIWLELGLIYKLEALTPAGKAFLFIRSPAGEDVLHEYGVLPGVSRS